MVRIDLTPASTHAVTAWDRGAGKTFESMFNVYLGLWSFASLVVCFVALQYRPAWSGWLFGTLFLAFTPALVALASSISYSIRSRRWPDLAVPGYGNRTTVRSIMRELGELRRRHAQTFGRPARKTLAWVYALLIPAATAALWWLSGQLNAYPSRSPSWWILTSAFGISTVMALLLFAIEARAAATPGFPYEKPWRGARLIRVLAVAWLPLPTWAALEASRVFALEEWVISRGYPGAQPASEVVPIVALFLAWCLSMYVIGKSIGRPLNVAELTEKYREVQITMLRPFQDDDATVDFGNPMAPDERWKTIRVEPAIAQSLSRYGPVVALSGADRTIGRFGAIKTKVSAADWQNVVAQWIGDSMIIVMLAGDTTAIEWELRCVIERGKAPALLLLLLPTTTDHLGQVSWGDREARWTRTKESFRGSPWFEAVEALDVSDVIALHFLRDGRVVALCHPRPDENDYRIGIAFGVYGMMCHAWAG